MGLAGRFLPEANSILLGTILPWPPASSLETFKIMEEGGSCPRTRPHPTPYSHRLGGIVSKAVTLDNEHHTSLLTGESLSLRSCVANSIGKVNEFFEELT